MPKSGYLRARTQQELEEKREELRRQGRYCALCKRYPALPLELWVITMLDPDGQPALRGYCSACAPEYERTLKERAAEVVMRKLVVHVRLQHRPNEEEIQSMVTAAVVMQS